MRELQRKEGREAAAKAREALRAMERFLEPQLGTSGAMAIAPGKATLTQGLQAATPAAIDQLHRMATRFAVEVENLEQANRCGDLSRALSARAELERFLSHAPQLLTALPPRAANEFKDLMQEFVERAAVALENGPNISRAAMEGARRRDYRQWDAELAPWRAKADPAAKADADAKAKAKEAARRESNRKFIRLIGARGVKAPSEDSKRPPNPVPHQTTTAVNDDTHQAAGLDDASEPTTPTPPDDTAPSTMSDERYEDQVAMRGTEGAGGPLPHLRAIQDAFGHHDVSSVRAHVGGPAAAASDALGARAYAYGDAIAFASAPDLHTAAHEAAHVVQQRRGVARGLGMTDAHERHADLVADAVVRGHSAVALLDGLSRFSSGSSRSAAVVQRKKTSGEPATTHSAPELTPEAGAETAPEMVRPAGSKWPVFAETGLPYKIESKNGQPGFWVARAWIKNASDITYRGRVMYSPLRARELLTALGWVAPANMDFAAAKLGFKFSKALNFFLVGADAANATGLPPGRDALVERDSIEGLLVTVPLDNKSLPPGHPHVLTASETQQAIQAAADFTRLPFDPEGHSFVMTKWVHPPLKTGNGVVAAKLNRAVCRTLFGFEAYNAWLGDKQKRNRDEPEVPKLKLENYYKSPIPGRLTHNGDVVEHNEEIRLEVLVDWPNYYPNAEIYDVPPMVTPSKNGTVALLQCQWTFKRLDGKAEGPSPKDSVETLSTSLAEAEHRFKLAPGEASGLFLATCEAKFDAYFEPTTIKPRQIVVLSAAEAMSQQQAKAFANLGADNPDRKNDRWTGDVRPGFRASPAAGSPEDIADPMAKQRAAQREQLSAVANYLGDKPANAEAVAAIENEVARQEASEKLLSEDRGKGWQSFQIRGTYLSRTEGVPTGPLDLHGTVHIEFHQDSYAGDGPSTTQHVRNDKVKVQIRDLSRRFKHVDFAFTGHGDTFDEALKDAFDDLAVTYPKGLVSIEAEQIRHGALRQIDGAPGAQAAQGPTTGKVVGFQRSTETTWKQIKETVWSPVASVAVNLGAIAIMVLVPGAGTAIGVTLLVYNAVPTIDHMKSLADSGTLTTKEVALSTGEIALNLLPMLSRAKALSAGWFAVETANWGGQVALMSGKALGMARELQSKHVAALAQEYQQFLELKKTSRPSDPDLAAAEEKIRAQAAEVNGEISRLFWEQMQANAIQMVAIAAAGSAVHNVSGKGRTAILDRLAKRAAAKTGSDAPVVGAEPPANAAETTLPDVDESAAAEAADTSDGDVAQKSRQASSPDAVDRQPPAREPREPATPQAPVRRKQDVLTGERLEQLRAGLSDELRNLPIHEVENLRGKDAQVRYRDGEIVLEVGPDAAARQVRYHAATAKALLKYRGPLGRIRMLLEDILTKLRIMPGYGTAGFEARLEVKKLRAIEADVMRLRDALEKGAQLIENGRAVTERELAAELRSVDEQIVFHQSRLRSFDAGTGVVAAKGNEERPVYAVRIADVDNDAKIQVRGSIDRPQGISVSFNGPDVRGREPFLGTVEIKHNDNGEVALTMALDTRVTLDGVTYGIKMFPDVANPDGIPTGVGEPISFTQFALDRAMQKYRALGHGDVDVLGGSLADDNKANFQLEYAAARDAGLDLDAALQQAARNISFGDHRIRRGYTELEVKVDDWEWLEPVNPNAASENMPLIGAKTRSGAGIKNQQVPQDITINARRPRT